MDVVSFCVLYSPATIKVTRLLNFNKMEALKIVSLIRTPILNFISKFVDNSFISMTVNYPLFSLINRDSPVTVYTFLR